jgi:two-component system response regulator NreC
MTDEARLPLSSPSSEAGPCPRDCGDSFIFLSISTDSIDFQVHLPSQHQPVLSTAHGFGKTGFPAVDDFPVNARDRGMAVSILIADAIAALRRGVRAWLEDDAGFQILGEASDGPETIRLVQTKKPDVLVLDVHMPGMNGLDVLGLCRKDSPRTRGVIYSNLAQERYVVEALRKGALAYVLKSSPTDALLQGVQAAAKGVHFLDAPFADQPLEAYLKKAEAQPIDPLDGLTQREKEVLHLVAEGNSNTEIARRLHLSSRTVEQHRAHLMRKLQLRNQTELICFALRRGIIALED